MDDPRPYDQKLDRILALSAEVFAERGFDRASIRDISKATGVSLSGLYYYFSSKDELLFLIQHRCFESLLERQTTTLEVGADADARLQSLVRTHVGFFLENMARMKVLSHEADVLEGEYAARVLELKKQYVRLVEDCLRELRPDVPAAALRVATFALFGQMNWIYTWYRPERDPGAEELADSMSRLFLAGFSDPRRA